MHDDPFRYWHDLTENYRQMSDGELLELSAKPEDLTEIARQVLRDEIKCRRLEKQGPATAGASTGQSKPAPWDLDGYHATPDAPDGTNAEEDGGFELTWKTRLCDCETQQQAWQLSEALRRAGIESWIQAPRSSTRHSALDLTYPRIVVAADQLEQARAVAAQPIPQDIVEESVALVEEDPEEFAVPICPKCGAHDPVLESVDPVNAWVCEACGAEWTDPEATAADDESEE